MTPSTMERRKKLQNGIKLLLPSAFWLGAWQLAAFLVARHAGALGGKLLLPCPADVFAALIRLAGEPAFWGTAAASLLRIAAGMAAGVILGAALAWAACFLPGCGRIISPAIRIIRATPVASFILLVLLWTGRNQVPAIISALIVLPVVWSNLTEGIRAADGSLLELARAYRFSRWKTLRLVYLPSLKPYLISAVTTAMGLAWKSGVAAEVLCLPRPGIGTQIYNTKLYLEIPELFAWTLVVVALSLLMESLLARILRRARGEGDRP